MKNLAVHYENDIVQLRTKCTRLQEDLMAKHTESDMLQKDIDYKQDLIQRYEIDMQKQVEIVGHLNNEVLKQKHLKNLENVFRCLTHVRTKMFNLKSYANTIE